MINKDDSKISILIVPHTEKVKRISVSKKSLKIGFSIFSALIIFTSFYIGKVHIDGINSKKESYKIKKIIHTLEKDNKTKDKELAKLKTENIELKTHNDEVEEKLVEIEGLQRKVEKMTGTKTPSRGGNISGRNTGFNSLESNDQLEVISDVLDDKKLELEVFVEDLGDRLDYLETVPDLMPTNGRLTSKYGNRRDPFTGGVRLHKGIDIANSQGTIIKASGKGRVIFSGTKRGLGQVVIIDHDNGYRSLYAHNSQLLVKNGEDVDKGQEISKMGSTGRSTGPHLHFEIHKNGKTINPLDIIKK